MAAFDYRNVAFKSAEEIVQCEAVFLLFRRLWDCALQFPRSPRMTAGLDEFMAKAELSLSVVTVIMIADGIAVGIMTEVCTAR
jgi:hypothetical protein